MTTILQRYLLRRLAAALALATLAIYLPVLLLSLFAHLPPAAVFSGLLWPALAGIAPMIFYTALPAIAAGAIVWTYGDMEADGTLAMLYNTGLSTARVRRPALALAAAACLLGYAVAWLVTPPGAQRLHDVLHVVQNQFSPELLEPGRLYAPEGGARQIRFGERRGRAEVADIYFREVLPGGEERRFYAARARFERRPGQSWILLEDGIMETRMTEGQVDVARFNQLARPSGLAGSDLPRRSWRGAFELGPAEFLQAGAEARRNPAEGDRWWIEAVKRLGIPPLALAHTLLGLSLLMLLRGEYRRTWGLPVLCCAGLLGLHLLIAAAVEAVNFYGPVLAWAVSGVIVAELALGAGLYVALVRRRPGPFRGPLVQNAVTPEFSRTG